MANKTATFLAAIPAETKSAILGNIAKHYGITESMVYREVIDPAAEHLLDYVTGPMRAATHALMLKHGAM